MCCLRYEYDTYQEEIRRTPKADQIVSTPDGEGIVTEVQPLAGLVRVRFTGRRAEGFPPRRRHGHRSEEQGSETAGQTGQEGPAAEGTVIKAAEAAP